MANDIVDNLLKKLRPDASSQEKAWLVIQDFLEGLRQPIVDAIYYCAISHWFNLKLLAWLKPADSDLSVEDLYTFITTLPFVEKYQELGYSLNATIRNILLEHLWHADRNKYKQLSRQIASFLEKVIEQEEKHLLEKGSRAQYVNRLIVEYQHELIYHLLVAEEKAGIKQLKNLLATSKENFQSSRFYALFQTLSEHELAGRLSSRVRMWIQYWKVRFSWGSSSLDQPASILSEYMFLLEKAEAVKDKGMEVLVNDSLSNTLAQSGKSEEAWQHFFRARFLLAKAEDYALFRVVSLNNASSPLNIENPNPNDYLRLGLNLPSDPLTRFIGRARELNQLVSWLQESAKHPITVISGLGGIGKTFLAYAVARSALSKGIVEKVYWTSAKMQTFVGENIDLISDRSNSNDFLAELMQNLLGLKSNIRGYPITQLIDKLGEYFKENRILLVIDNVETFADANILTECLPKIMGQSRAIVTSRLCWDLDNAQTVMLRGVDESTSFSLLHWSAHGSERSSTKIDFWRNIHRLTGGHPLVMKLVETKLANKLAEEIQDQLQEGEGNIYNYIYADIWNELSEEARKLLRLVSNANRPVTKSFLGEVCISESLLNEALAQLEKVAFVQVKEDPKEDEVKYETDPLTRHYVHAKSS